MSTTNPSETSPYVPNPYTSNILLPALKVASATGTAGLVFGGLVSIFAPPKNPALRITVNGINWFILGATYYSAREFTKRRMEAEVGELKYGHKVGLSAFAGWATGNVAGVMAGNMRSMISGGIIFALLSAGGQVAFMKLDETRLERVQDFEAHPEKLMETKSLVDRVFESRWSPLKKLTPEEYEETMQERIMKIEVERALIKEEIDKLKAQLVVEKENEAKEDREEKAASEAAAKKP